MAARSLVDREGDAVRARIWRLVWSAADLSKRAGAYEAHAALVEAIGLAARYDELDEAEGGHDAPIVGYAEATRSELKTASDIQTALLGGRTP